jgi:hypothetical protein
MAHSEGMASSGVLYMIVPEPQVHDPLFKPDKLSDGVCALNRGKLRTHSSMELPCAWRLTFRVPRWTRGVRLPELSNCYCHPGRAGGTPMTLVLLCHKLRRGFRVKRRAQQGHRGSIRAMATINIRCTVAIELGMCRWGRIGGAAGSVTTGNGRFREPPGATWS